MKSHSKIKISAVIIIVCLSLSNFVSSKEPSPLTELQYINSTKGIKESRENRSYVKNIYKYKEKFIECKSIELTTEFFKTSGNYGGSEYWELFHNTARSILINNSMCFLSAFAILKDKRAKESLAHTVLYPYGITSAELLLKLKVYEKTNEFQYFFSFLTKYKKKREKSHNKAIKKDV